MKKFILSIIIFILFVPFLVQVFGIMKEKELDGIKDHAKKPVLIIKNIFEVAYQDSLNKYLSENFGFRNTLIKSYNQLIYSIFRKTNAPGVVDGKNGFLFIESYINNYIGINYIGDKEIDRITNKIKTLQDTLKKYNVDLVIIFAPGKASYYHEYIPDYYNCKAKSTNNHDEYEKAFRGKNINFIDFNSWFVNIKNKTKFKLYPRYGTHWNSFGVALATDSIIHYIEKLRNIKLPDFNYDEVTMSDSLRNNDYDIGELLNIYKKLKDTMPYPEYKFTYNETIKKPSVLAIGDSYWWCLIGANIPKRIFLEDEYWFYNKDVYIDNCKQSEDASSKNLRNEILKRDVIILMASEATYDLFPYGFIDNAYSAFCMSKEDKIKEYINKMEKDEKWLNEIKEKAIKNNVSVEEQKLKDAEFLYSLEYISKNEIINRKNEKLSEIRKKIMNTPKWLNQIKEKAIANKISLEQQLNLDIDFVYRTESVNK